MYKFIIFLMLSAVISVGSAIAEEITGKVSGEDPDGKVASLPGAVIKIEDTGKGTLANSDGTFRLEISDFPATLIAEYVGYRTDTIRVESAGAIEFKLTADFTTEDVTVEEQTPTKIVDRAGLFAEESLSKHGLQKGACCNLGESFQATPSVDLEYSDALTGAKKIKLLGLDGVYGRFLAEKTPDLRGAASTFGLSYIPGPWMESVSMSKGAASVTTGYESITGQINVEYKKAETSESFYGNVFGSNHGRFELDANTKWNVSDRLSSVLFLHGGGLNTKTDLNDDGFLDQPMFYQLNALNRWDYTTDNYFLHLKFQGLYEDRSGGQVGYENDKENKYGIGVETARAKLFGKTSYIFDTPNYQSLGAIFYAANHDQNSFYGRRDYDVNQKSAYLNVLYQFSLGSEEEHSEENEPDEHSENSNHEEHGLELNHSFTTGANFQFDRYDESFEELIFDRDESVGGLYLEYTLGGLGDFLIGTGAGVDFHNLFGTFFSPRAHVRYRPADNFTLRASGGKGFRSANVLTENSGHMASSREFVIEEDFDVEEAWNYGFNGTYDFYLFEKFFTLNFEFYRTDFVNKIIADLDRDPQSIYFYNLDGESFSNSFQIDLTFDPIQNLTTNVAYRRNDVKQTENGELVEVPFVNRDKGFANAEYSINGGDWKFDFTAEYNGGGRLPNTSSNPEEYGLSERFDGFFLFHGQISKKLGDFEFYLGGENLADFKQETPILDYRNPFGEYFDASMVWGPILGRKLHLGIRYSYF